MDKTLRLRLLKEIGQRHAEREASLVTALPEPSIHDIKDEIGIMDTFREDQRENLSVKGVINSDEF